MGLRLARGWRGTRHTWHPEQSLSFVVGDKDESKVSKQDSAEHCQDGLSNKQAKGGCVTRVAALKVRYLALSNSTKK